ncbi:uncharacterized protein LOC116146156 isoform X2 [Pistacia vera]|uniref:uncharacterized protein LOC116146156 isoform X2 n=1 Tax=Pistacia vera TaxID=55513 RepID=UPI0012637142|nr:uncharacterized protein LOC116146156 isoform X2 [Pistacia vera]
MNATVHQSLLNYVGESDSEEREKEEGMVRKGIKGEGGGEINEVLERVQCMTLRKGATIKRGEEISSEKYDLWRQEQKRRAARLGKQLKSRWELQELIEEQLNRFRSHYNHAMVPIQLKDVAELLMPRWTPPHELAALSWLGDWRPSAILDLICGLVCPSTSLSSSSSSLSNSGGIERLLSQVIHEIRIEESIIDEEMSEIQATCILHLPFASLNKRQSGGSTLGFIQEEFKKIERVITKAQQLRYKTLELAVKKVLSQTDAAQFLVAFAEIQDVIHQVAEQLKLRKVLVTLPTKASRPKLTAANLRINLNKPESVNRKYTQDFTLLSSCPDL